MKLILYLYFTIFLIHNLSCKYDKNILTEGNNIEKNDHNKTFEIDHFLFLRKGMNLNSAIDYLNSNNIKYKVFDHKDWNDSIFTYKIPNECTKVLRVLNLKVVDKVIDKMEIYFIDNQIFTLHYKKETIVLTDMGIDGNEMNTSKAMEELSNFITNNIGIMKLIYSGLLNKYGSPTLSNSSTSNYFVENLSSLSEIDSNKKRSAKFDVSWNDQPVNQYSDSIIRIRISNELSNRKKDLFSTRFGQSFQYIQIIEVDFTNNILITKLDSCNKFKVTLEPRKKDSNDIKKEQLERIL